MSTSAIDWARLRADFPVLERQVHGKPLVYLDSANTSQKPRAVIDKVDDFYRAHNANVSRAVHALGSEATEAFEAARTRLAAFVGVHRDELVLTSGTTQAINTVAYSHALPQLKPNDAILLTRMEHHANIVPWQLVAQRSGATIKVAEITQAGELDLDALRGAMTPDVKLLGVTHVSNVLGTVNPVADICREARRRGIATLVDGSQAVPHRPVDIAAIGCDFYAFTGHKMLGPTGTGALWGRRELLQAMPPFLGGGEMIREVRFDGTTFNDAPHKFEAGTPDIAAEIGLGVAAAYLGELGMDRVREHEKELVTYALGQLMTTHPDVALYGPLDAELRGGVVPFNIPGVHPHDVAQVLDSHGVAIRAGHHCTMPLHERLDLPATVRASFNVYTTKADIDALTSGITEVKRLFGPG